MNPCLEKPPHTRFPKVEGMRARKAGAKENVRERKRVRESESGREAASARSLQFFDLLLYLPCYKAICAGSYQGPSRAVQV